MSKRAPDDIAHGEESTGKRSRQELLTFKNRDGQVESTHTWSDIDSLVALRTMPQDASIKHDSVFLASRSILCRDFMVFKDILTLPAPENPKEEDVWEGHPVIVVQDYPCDLQDFLEALHDWRSYTDSPKSKEVIHICALVRMGTKYQVGFLREKMITELSARIPTSLGDFKGDTAESNSEIRDGMMLLGTLEEIDYPLLLPIATFLVAVAVRRSVVPNFLIRAPNSIAKNYEKIWLSSEQSRARIAAAHLEFICRSFFSLETTSLDADVDSCYPLHSHWITLSILQAVQPESLQIEAPTAQGFFLNLAADHRLFRLLHLHILRHQQAPVNEKGVYGRVPLVYAACQRETALVRTLLEHGAHVDIADNNNRTALFYVSELGYGDVVLLLLKYGACVDAPDHEDRTPLIIACIKGHYDVALALLDHGAVFGASAPGVPDSRPPETAGSMPAPSERLESPFIHALTNGHRDIGRILIHKGASVFLADRQGRFPLMHASEHGHCDSIRLLIEHGAEATVNCANKSGGETALIYASQNGHQDAALILLQNGAMVDKADEEGKTPIIHTLERGHLSTALLLLQHGAIVTLGDKKGRTPLMYALHLKDWEPAVLQLLGHGASLDADPGDIHSMTPLMYACKRSLGNAARLLLQLNPALVNVPTSQIDDRRTPLISASTHGSRDIVLLLLQHGATVNTPDSYGRTPLSHACSEGHWEIALLLLQHAASVDAADCTGETPLMKVCKACCTEIMIPSRSIQLKSNVSYMSIPGEFLNTAMALLDHGATVNAVDNSGRTPLMHAVAALTLTENQVRPLSIQSYIHLLLQHGADLSMRDDQGQTALMLVDSLSTTDDSQLGRPRRRNREKLSTFLHRWAANPLEFKWIQIYLDEWKEYVSSTISRFQNRPVAPSVSIPGT